MGACARALLEKRPVIWRQRFAQRCLSITGGQAKEKPPTIGADIDNWGRTDLEGNPSILCAYAIDAYASSERCLSRCALTFPTTRRRSLPCSSALQSGTALLSHLDFLRRSLPTHDVPSWRSPDGDCHCKILRNLETMMACFLVRHRWWRCDTH